MIRPLQAPPSNRNGMPIIRRAALEPAVRQACTAWSSSTSVATTGRSTGMCRSWTATWPEATGGGMGESSDVGLVVDFVVDVICGHQAAGDAFLLGANGNPLVEALVHLAGQGHVNSWPVGVVVPLGHAASSCCWQ